MDQLIIEGKDIIYSKENPVSSYRLATPEERKVIALSYIRDLEEGDERFNISVATEDKKIDTFSEIMNAPIFTVELLCGFKIIYHCGFYPYKVKEFNGKYIETFVESFILSNDNKMAFIFPPNIDCFNQDFEQMIKDGNLREVYNDAKFEK